MTNRRHFLIASLVTATTISDCTLAADQPPISSLGLCQYCASFARQQLRHEGNDFDLFRPENFFAHAKRLGAGGYQVELGILDSHRAGILREQADAAGMYIEGMVTAPKKPADLERFEAEMKSAAAVGARAVRSTIFTGRRYEFFESMEQYHQHDAQALRSLELAAPIAEKYRVAFAPENHKDHRVDERVAALKKIDSEYVGACVDTGNNFALLEDCVQTVTALAPWAHAVHLKDQSVQRTDTGFLFGDIPLGQGFIDLPQIVAILRTARPTVNFTLELLTRDPLDVPCLEPQYWTTFPDLPAADLARTLRMVRDHEVKEMQYPSRLTLDQQVALEEQNVRQSLSYAKDVLKI
jgi:3-oxoisoapionate decarboxylase